MRVLDNGNSVVLWASANDTYDWAHKPGAAWPCSTLSGHRFVAAFDTNGLYELTVNGRDAPTIDGCEFNAITSDLLEQSGKVPEDHPVWFVTVGQFKG